MRSVIHHPPLFLDSNSKKKKKKEKKRKEKKGSEAVVCGLPFHNIVYCNVCSSCSSSRSELAFQRIHGLLLLESRMFVQENCLGHELCLPYLSALETLEFQKMHSPRTCVSRVLFKKEQVAIY